MAGSVFTKLDHVTSSRFGREHVVETGKPEKLTLRYIYLLFLVLKLLLNFLKRFCRNIAKSVIDLAQDGNQRISFCSVFFDRLLHNGRDIAFNCWCNHQASMIGVHLSRFNRNGIEVTNLHTNATADTGILIDMMDLAA